VTTAVLDASVAAKWAFPAAGETLVEQAVRLLRRYAQGEIRLIVPDIFWAEFGNISWKGVRQGRWSRALAEKAVSAMLARQFPTVLSAGLLSSAFVIAINFERSVYDSLYVALAVSSKAPLITADERLANALAAHFPVKWLGSI
jgi:predicted nucleic acid-binding protein